MKSASFLFPGSSATGSDSTFANGCNEIRMSACHDAHMMLGCIRMQAQEKTKVTKKNGIGTYTNMKNYDTISNSYGKRPYELGFEIKTLKTGHNLFFP